jgi:hypothetical protein
MDTMDNTTQATDEQIVEAIDMGQRASRARARGDETLASHLTRTWQATLPAYGTDERRWLQVTFDNAYREESAKHIKPEIFR